MTRPLWSALTRLAARPAASGAGETETLHGFETLRTMDTLQRYNAWLWSQLSPYIGQRILEAGCGTGTFTRYLSARERVVSLDFDRHYVSIVRAEHAGAANVRVEWADLAAAEWPDLSGEALDTVVSMNVIEHLPDDAVVVRRFWELLQPGGRVALLVPAHARLYGAIDAAIGHYRRYNRSGFSTLLRAAGFEVEKARYLNPTGVLGWYLNGRVLRRTTVPLGQATWYDRVYPILSQLERLNLPFGLSVLAIGRKPR